MTTSSERPLLSSVRQVDPEDDEPSMASRIVSLLLLIGRHRRTFLVLPVAGIVVGLLFAFLLPKRYTAITRILPPQQTQSTAAAMLAQIGGAAAGLASGALGIKNPNDLFVAMLKSDRIADALIAKYDLRAVYGESMQVTTRKALAEDTEILPDKSGVIAIRVEAGTPALAADLANAYVRELQGVMSTLAVTEAAQRRVFFEKQLQQTKDRLAVAEHDLHVAIDRGGLVSVDAQSRAALETVGRLRAQITAKEIQLNAVGAFATRENPDLRRLENELASMKHELARLESGDAESTSDGKANGLASVKLLREVKYQEVMFELLARQYELARVDEAKEAPLIQVLDGATPPERKSKPKRAYILVGALAMSLLAAFGLALGREWWDRLRLDPEGAAALEALRQTWKRAGPTAPRSTHP